MGEHFFGDVDHTVAGSFGTGERTAPADTLTGQNTFPAMGKLLVSAVKISDLTAADTNITRGDIFIWPDVIEQFGHESLTEGHHFSIGLAARVEVRTALTAADRLTGESIFEDLLKTEKINDRAIN